MSSEITILVLSIGYLGLLFAVAWIGDRSAPRWSKGTLGPIVYGLSLAIYCTSWTFYGSVGRAATVGPDFILIYAGPILVMVLGHRLMRQIVRLAKRNNVTSIADFLAARYGKSRAVAVTATLVACVGVIPYIALQLQAVSATFRAISGPVTMMPGSEDRIAENTALIVTAMMAVFTILFGVRNAQVNEQHRGVMLAIAFESVVKLGAFLAVGTIVVWGLFDGPASLFAQVIDHPRVANALAGTGPTPAWLATTALAALAFLCLPRQFHVAVVEHDHPSSLRVARWLFPLYLVLINLFVIPIAAAGLLMAPGQNPDLFVLILPVANGHQWLSILVFIGGLSAATSMVIVACMALSSMIGNELVMPYLLHRHAGSGAQLSGLLINVRRLSVIVILLAAYAYHRIVSGSLPLVSIGLVSFCAVANLGPGLLLGLYWRRAHRHGVVAGLTGGFIVWFWSLLLPSLAQAWDGVVTAPLADVFSGPLATVDAVSQGFLASIAVNLILTVGVSLLARHDEQDRWQADAFVSGVEGAATPLPQPPATAARIGELRRLLAQFVGSDRAERAFAGQDLSMSSAVAVTERLLSGIVGAASARLIVAAVEPRRISPLAARALLDEASEAIRHNYGILRNSLDHVGLGFAAFDRLGSLEIWNDRFASLLSITPALLAVGLRPESLRGNPRLAELLRRPEAPRVHEIRDADGNVVELRLDPLPEGGFVATCIDVTSRVRTAEALRDSERRIRVYTDNVPVLIAYIDREERYRFTNRPYQAAFRLEAPPIGRSVPEVIGLPRYQRLKGFIDGVLAGEPQQFEIEFPTNDANIELAAGTYLPHVDEAGQVVGFFLLYQDISAARRAEVQLRQANESLERRVTERTAELTRVVAELERSREAAITANLGKTRFIAAASHDLLQPLHAAQLFVAALADRQPGNDLVGKIGQGLGAVEALLDALLDISKLDSGVLKPEPRDFALMPMLDSLVTAFTPVAQQRGADLRLVSCAAAINTDPALLRRILQNLVSNALRYSGADGRVPRVLIGCRHSGASLRIEVWDNGPGISEDQHALVFQEFVRLHPAAAGRATDRGLGLGLAIVDRMARMLGLPIGLRSVPGRGSVFAVTVPVAASPTQMTTVPTPIAHAERDNLSSLVLCIDNEPQVRDAMASLIGGWGCRVCTAHDLAEARAQVERVGERPDLILADFHLDHGPDGLEAIRTLRALWGNDVAAALITADRSPELRRRTRELGIDLLHKPVKPAALRSLLRGRLQPAIAVRA